jgi:hypothetical protein
VIDRWLRQIHVDREQELDLFRSMVARTRSISVLIIEAEGGMGKSSLLSQMWAECHQHPRARVDLKAAKTCEEVMQQLAEQLPGDFPKFSEQLAEFSRTGVVHVEGIAMIMSRITADLGTPDPVKRGVQRRLLTHALLDDLQAANATKEVLVVTVDTFEKATVEVGHWMNTCFLPAATRLPWLLLVIAGQVSPDLDFDMTNACISTRLNNLDRESVQQYVREVERIADAKLSLSDDQIQIIHELNEGRPLDIATDIGMLCRKRGLTVA